jgi:crossover junction endodeoxyribonuclease RusA
VKFAVAAVPVPQGSKRVVHGHLIDVNQKNLRSWRQLVAAEAARQGEPPLGEAVAISLTFYLPRPKAHFGVRGLRPSAPGVPQVRPDLDKMIRAVLDALTGVAWRDDAQIASIVASKLYADTGPPGVEVTIETLTRQEEL